MRGGVWEGGREGVRGREPFPTETNQPSSLTPTIRGERVDWHRFFRPFVCSLFFPSQLGGSALHLAPFSFFSSLAPHPSSFLVVPSISPSSSSSFTAIPSSTFPLPPLLFYFLFTVTPSNNSTINSTSESRHSFPGLLITFLPVWSKLKHSFFANPRHYLHIPSLDPLVGSRTTLLSIFASRLLLYLP
ncbi:uncharacterized protein LY79DRAFT_139739 [Colletotrichum navitas]|uniref:Uncharacterized protein n=1 Tax=Colletotrichum navitas TaxID=681940 RepID=A0AAD8V9K4_9PEZI|nr:uncharacterized protein LY79DRAFT_139739 [Colletotrichum navitas]KAK1599402.1 hypothetical protein LY79DRAFT_139739 [Colletotrichum navitas]